MHASTSLIKTTQGDFLLFVGKGMKYEYIHQKNIN